MALSQANESDISAMRRGRLAVRENTLSDPSLMTESDDMAALDELGRRCVIEVDGEIVAFATGWKSAASGRCLLIQTMKAAATAKH